MTEVPLRFLIAENARRAGRERCDARLRHTNNIIQPLLRVERNKRVISFMTLFDRFQLPLSNANIYLLHILIETVHESGKYLMFLYQHRLFCRSSDCVALSTDCTR